MKFKIIRNDITNMNVNALVLPANSELREGSGTSKAIFEKAGREELAKACKKAKKEYGKLYKGSAVPTPGFGLNADFIIHAVVPVWRGGAHQEYEQLSSAYLSALKMSDAMNCVSIAFPLLGAGNNGFDFQLAFEIAEKSIESFEPKKELHTVYLVVYDTKTMIMLQEINRFVKEQIDDKYVLENDETYKFYVQRKVEKGTEAAKDFLNNGIEAAKKCFNDTVNKKHTLEMGMKIARMVLEAASGKKPLGYKRCIRYNEAIQEGLLNPGDIVCISRNEIYEHYAVYIGDNEVIHYAAENGDFTGQISIRRASFKDFLRDSDQLFVIYFPENYFSPEETIKRAKSRLNEANYNIISNNCEHFAIWCKTGISESHQVDVILKGFRSFLSATDRG